MALDLNKLKQKVITALSNETRKSLTEWIRKKREQNYDPERTVPGLSNREINLIKGSLTDLLDHCDENGKIDRTVIEDILQRLK